MKKRFDWINFIGMGISILTLIVIFSTETEFNRPVFFWFLAHFINFLREK